MIVVDASAVLDVLIRSTVADAIERRMFAPGESLHAPHLIDLEVVQVLRRHAAAGEATPQRFREALDDFMGFPISRYPHDAMLDRIWELRHVLSSYDAAYVALAEALSAPLLTRDRKLAAAAKAMVEVELI